MLARYTLPSYLHVPTVERMAASASMRWCERRTADPELRWRHS
ncbi:hypothetical protein ACFQE8_12990 [Salinirubellus sp. GCM10025818]